MTDWKKKETLIRTRNWSGFYVFEEYKHYRKTIKTRAILKTRKILNTMGYITPNMGHYPRNG